jgi:hypothetical protein
MKFNLKKPCSNCPFRKDIFAVWLGENRVREITNGLANDGTFACHKTTGAELGKEINENKHSHCVGAIFVLEKEMGANANLMLRLAIMFGWLNVGSLDGAELVFDSFDEMIKHHR